MTKAYIKGFLTKMAQANMDEAVRNLWHDQDFAEQVDMDQSTRHREFPRFKDQYKRHIRDAIANQLNPTPNSPIIPSSLLLGASLGLGGAALGANFGLPGAAIGGLTGAGLGGGFGHWMDKREDRKARLRADLLKSLGPKNVERAAWKALTAAPESTEDVKQWPVGRMLFGSPNVAG